MGELIATLVVCALVGGLLVLLWVDNRRDLKMANEIYNELTEIHTLYQDDNAEMELRMRAVNEKMDDYLSRPTIFPFLRRPRARMDIPPL